MNDELNKTLEDFKQYFSQLTKDRDVYKTGKLANEVSYSVKIDGGTYRIKVSFVEYAKYLEYGTYDYKEKPADFSKWILISKSLPRPQKLPKGLKRLPGAKKGILPRHLIADSVDEFLLITKIKNNILNIIRKELEEPLK